MNFAAHFRIQTAALDDNLLGRPDGDIDCDDDRLAARNRRWFAATANVEHRHIGRQRVGNADLGADHMNRPGGVDALPRLAADMQIGVESRGEDVACHWLSVFRSDLEVERHAGLEHAEASGHRHAAGHGRRLETLDEEARLVADDLGLDIRQIHAAGIVA